MIKSAAEQAAELWRERNPEQAAAGDDRRARTIFDELNIDFRKSYVDAFRHAVMKSVAEQIARAQVVAAAPILAAWGSVHSVALTEPDGMAWVMFPPDVDAAQATQLAGSREGQDRKIARVRVTWKTKPAGYSIKVD